MSQFNVSPTPRPVVTHQHNWNSTVMILILGAGMLFGLSTFKDIVSQPFPEETPTVVATTAPAPQMASTIIVRAVLELPATATPHPTSTPKPTYLDLYGSCDGKRPGQLCVQSTATPAPGTVPIVAGTPVKLPSCATVGPGTLCVMPTPYVPSEGDVVVD